MRSFLLFATKPYPEGSFTERLDTPTERDDIWGLGQTGYITQALVLHDLFSPKEERRYQFYLSSHLETEEEKPVRWCGELL